MKILLYILLVTSPIISMAQTAAEGGYIVVRGAVKDCIEWPNRILDAVKIDNQEPVTILEIPGFYVVGLNHKQVENELYEAIEHVAGKRPETLSVEILASDAAYQTIAKEHLISVNALVAGSCPYRKIKDAKKIQEEELEKMRLMEISRRIALRNTYDKRSNIFHFAQQNACCRSAAQLKHQATRG